MLDEPSLGLAPLVVQDIFSIIARINREQGVAMLLVEQNAHVALGVAHYGYILENGRIVVNGPTATLLNDPDVQRFYLGRFLDPDQGARGGRPQAQALPAGDGRPRRPGRQAALELGRGRPPALGLLVRAGLAVLAQLRGLEALPEAGDLGRRAGVFEILKFFRVLGRADP